MKRLVILGVLALAACTEERVADGAKIYVEQCADCHGASGMGDGVVAQGLDRKPSNLTTIASRNGGVFDRDAVMSQIDGMHRSADSAMPEFGASDLGDIIMVGRTPVPAELYALANYLEGIQG